MRHKLVQRIVEAYKRHSEETGTAPHAGDRGRGREPLAASTSTRTARVELVRRVLAAEGVDSGEVGLAFVSPEESRALKREHLGVDEATDALAFPSTGSKSCRPGFRASSATSSSAREVVGAEWREPLVHAVLHLVGYDHGDEMEAREALHRDRDHAAAARARAESPPPAPGRAPSLLDSFNYAFEGIIHVLRTQRNLRIHFVDRHRRHRRGGGARRRS